MCSNFEFYNYLMSSKAREVRVRGVKVRGVKVRGIQVPFQPSR